MKALKKLSILLLALSFIFCIGLLTSCGEEETFNVMNLREYVVVIPENADATVTYAAENFALLAQEKTGFKPPVVKDNVPAVPKEILIGKTNREESRVQSELGEMQYLVFMKNDKIVIEGNGIYVGAACGDFMNKYANSLLGTEFLDVENVPSDEIVAKYTPTNAPKSVIFMIGDGMGVNHVLMAEKNGLGSFTAKEFPFAGESVTRSQSVINGQSSATDSAASGTAMATGYKTINGYIGLDKNGQSILNVRELAALSGAKTGVITTDVITGATPSSFMCHQGSRNDTSELQAQIDSLISQGKINYCAGDVGNELTNELKRALSTISDMGSPFFIMIEEGQIDKASHARKPKEALEYVIRFDDSIEYAAQFALCHPDVALIVTADHETGKLLEAPLKYSEYGYAFRTDGHTNVNVPIYAIGAGTSIFANATIENIELARFCATAFSSEPFGQTEPVE